MTVNTFYASLARKLEAGGSETIIYLDRITTRTGETITTADFATLGRGILTVNPDGDGISSFPEYISFTAIDSSAVSATTAIRGLSAKGNTVVAANKRFHEVGTPVVISFGAHQIQDIIDYVDNEVAALTVGTANAVTGIAGETISAAPALVYLKNDGKWWLTDADTAATVAGVQLGIALSAVAADAAITNGVVRKGLVSGFSGLVDGTTYYASNTPGEVSPSVGTNSKVVGVGRSTTQLYFDPEYNELPSGAEKAALAGGGALGIPSASNKYITEEYIGSGVTVQTFTSSGTWTKPAGLVKAVIEVVGGGGAGGGAAVNTKAGGGGGGGGYAFAVVAAASLGATETVTIGAAGAAGTGDGGAGGATSFGAHAAANGGSGGTGDTTNPNAGGAGGAATAGDIQITGGRGDYGHDDGTLVFCGRGGDSVFGFGGGSQAGAGQQSGFAGTGYGAGGGGGGSGSSHVSSTNGGAGTAGFVRVTEFYA